MKGKMYKFNNSVLSMTLISEKPFRCFEGKSSSEIWDALIALEDLVIGDDRNRTFQRVKDGGATVKPRTIGPGLSAGVSLWIDFQDAKNPMVISAVKDKLTTIFDLALGFDYAASGLSVQFFGSTPLLPKITNTQGWASEACRDLSIKLPKHGRPTLHCLIPRAMREGSNSVYVSENRENLEKIDPAVFDVFTDESPRYSYVTLG